MSRRRYVSTDISVDTRVNRLAEQASDFAALLYTWMIPHADDLGELTCDPEQLLFTVMPGRRSKSAADVHEAIAAMAELGLVEIDEARGKLRFPSESFYRYQSYVKAESRRQSAEHADEQRNSTEIAVSVPPPVPPPVSSPVRASGPNARRRARGGGGTQTPEISESDRLRVAQFEHRLAELGVEHPLSDDDELAVIRSREPPALLAEAFVAAIAGKWGLDWLVPNLELRFVVNKIAAYKAALRTGFAKNGRTASGNLTRDEQRAKYQTDPEAEQAQAQTVLANLRQRAGKDTHHGDHRHDGDGQGAVETAHAPP